MSEKKILPPVVLVAAQSLAASFNSTPTVFAYTDNISYQINITTSNSTGTFAVQGSLDYVQAGMGGPGVAGNWTSLNLSAVPTVAAANDTILINLNQVPYPALRLAYTAGTAGTGTCKIIVTAKGLS